MKRIRNSVQINAQAQRVFDYLAQPSNLLSIMPSMMEVSNIVPQAGGGSDYDWVYKMAGVRLKGHTKVEVFQPGKLLRVRTEGGIVSTWTFKFEGNGAGIKVSLDIEYTIPIPVLGKVAEKIVAKMNERESDLMLAHLKEITETEATGVVATAPARH